MSFRYNIKYINKFKNRIMKKLRLIVIVMMLFTCLTLHAQVPVSLDVNIGDSELRGLAGIELQVSRFALVGGWRPGLTPSGDHLNSWSAGLVVYGDEHVDLVGRILNIYASAGLASQGYTYMIEPYDYQHYKTVSSVIILVGAKTVLFPESNKNILCKFGVGCNISDVGVIPAFEVVFSYKLFKTK